MMRNSQPIPLGIALGFGWLGLFTLLTLAAVIIVMASA